MKKTLLGMLLLLTGSCLWVSCSDENEPAPQETLSTETIYANMLGKDIMSQLYYWNEDIAADLVQWDIETNGDPIGTVDRIRYHEGDKYIDKWTMMTDDMNSFTNSVEGVSTPLLQFYIDIHPRRIRCGNQYHLAFGRASDAPCRQYV